MTHESASKQSQFLTFAQQQKMPDQKKGHKKFQTPETCLLKNKAHLLISVFLKFVKHQLVAMSF